METQPCDESMPWWASPRLYLDWFLIGNIAFLAIDILLAHAINNFEHPGEWIPIGFSFVATLLLVIAQLVSLRWPTLGRNIGLAVGGGAIVVGIAGLLWHLNGDFFQQQTLKSLVYTAPFVAPLAYTGLGLLLVMVGMTDVRTREWWQWVLFLAAGGFAGNFVLSLADHAQNGFFYPTEWIGVVAGAIATGFLIGGAIVPESRVLLVFNAISMIAQLLVGLFGFYLHAKANLLEHTGSLWDRFIYGAPVFAPLLFADLAVLGLLGLWCQARDLNRPGLHIELSAE